MKHHSFRRRQGMTEYMVMLGLIALLLIAAVSEYGFRVDEAIQGSQKALENRMDKAKDDTAGNEAQKRGSSKKDGKEYDVWAWDKEDGSWEWKAVPKGTTPTASSPTYSSSEHGRMR